MAVQTEIKKMENQIKEAKLAVLGMLIDQKMAQPFTAEGQEVANELGYLIEQIRTELRSFN